MAGTKLIEQRDDRQWDLFVARHENGWLTHTSDWQKALEAAFRHIKGYRFAVVDARSGKILAGIPVYLVKSILTGKRLVSAPFATLCDPLTHPSVPLDRLVASLVDFLKREKGRYLELRSTVEKKALRAAGMTERPFFVQHYLQLNVPLKQLFKTFHRSCTRQRINRAQKSGLQLFRGHSENDLTTFFQLYTRARKRLALPPMPHGFFNELWQAFFHSDQIELLMAMKDHETIAAILAFKYNRRVSIEFAASDENYWKMSPNHFLFWEAIKIAHAQGFEIVDFGRTSPANASLMDFKRRWGTRTRIMPQYYYPAHFAGRGEDADPSSQYKAVRFVCSRAPVSLLPAIGRFCYRHMG